MAITLPKPKSTDLVQLVAELPPEMVDLAQVEHDELEEFLQQMPPPEICLIANYLTIQRDVLKPEELENMRLCADTKRVLIPKLDLTFPFADFELTHPFEFVDSVKDEVQAARERLARLARRAERLQREVQQLEREEQRLRAELDDARSRARSEGKFTEAEIQAIENNEPMPKRQRIGAA